MTVPVIHIPADANIHDVWVSGVDRVLIHQSHSGLKCHVFSVTRGTADNESLGVWECTA